MQQCSATNLKHWKENEWTTEVSKTIRCIWTSELPLETVGQSEGWKVIMESKVDCWTKPNEKGYRQKGTEEKRVFCWDQ